MQKRILTNNILVVDDFFSSIECDEYIAKSIDTGYEPATIETEKGQKIVADVRNNNRVIYNNQELANLLWQRIKPFAPQQIGNSCPVGLNELFRFYKYQPGQEFKKHRD